MAKPTGFMDFERARTPKRSVEDRKKDHKEIEQMLTSHELEIQATRCMDCGIPYCHSLGCPVHNRIPDFNDLIYRKQWRKALDVLHSTNNFPEITGRVCPAPCETACTLALDMEAVSIRQIELQLVERGWNEGWILPEPAAEKTGKQVAVVGSGPAGLAAAQQLARLGHSVTVFEKDERIGGLLRYGIPDFKLEKWVLDRRLDQMKAEGVIFETSVEAGIDLSVRYLRRIFDAILVAAGSREPRDLKVPGRELKGIHFAMDFLSQQNRRNASEIILPEDMISAKDKHVVVIGGGDTGSDCVGTSIRQGAKDVTQIELLPKPPDERVIDNPWPMWPMVLRTSSSHEEGCERLWSISTKEFLGQDGSVRKMNCVKLDWSEPDDSGRSKFKQMPGTEFELEADLVLLAMGFVHTEYNKLVKDSGFGIDKRGNIEIDEDWMTSAKGVFATGDAIRGASLIVWAIEDGRKAAESIHLYLSSL